MRRTDGSILAPNVKDHDCSHDNGDNMHETRRFASSVNTPHQKSQEISKRRTRLEDERPSNVYISAMACRLDSVGRPEQRAYDERGRLANAIKRPKLEHPE